MFTWIPMHREAIQRILEHRQNQNELLAMLREMEQQGFKVIGLEDEDADGKAIPLAEIDPFTFMASFNRGVTDENRRRNWSFLKTRWGLKSPVPNDFTGIPTLHPIKSWLFPYAVKREKNHVEHLWQIASLAADRNLEQVDEESFDRCLKLRLVGIGILTIGLFWINPENFLPCDSKTVAYGKARGVKTKPEDYRSYRQWLKEMTEQLGHNYPEISRSAHLFATQNRSPLELSPEQMEMLWARFHKGVKGFTDFTNPGTDFVDNETGYKRALLKKFRQELGTEKLSALVAQGQGAKARKEIVRLLTSNLVSFHGWNATLGETDEATCDVLGEYLKAASAPYEGPRSTQGIFGASSRRDLKPGWDGLSALLWALRPEDFFPIKITFFRKLSEELGRELPPGRPDAEKLHSLIEFGRAFWKALEPQKPSDWVDVQSFIWCVCSDDKRAETANAEVSKGALGVPFDELFRSVEDGRWSFELIRSALLKLGVTPEMAARDERISLTITARSDGLRLRLNFGNWAILTFFESGLADNPIEFVCRKDLIPSSVLGDSGDNQFADLIDESAFALIKVPMAKMRDDHGPERRAFEDSLALVAKRFADWRKGTYRKAHQPDLLKMTFDPQYRDRLLREGLRSELSEGQDEPVQSPQGTQHWWLNANPKVWNFEETEVGQKQTYTSHNEKGNKRQKFRYFQEAKPGDLVVGYVTSPQKEVVAICKITKGLHQTGKGEEIEFEKIEQLAQPIAYQTLQANPDLANSEPVINNQGSLFRLTEQEFEIIRSLIDETNLPLSVEIGPYDKKKAMKGLFLAETQFDEMLDALKEKKNLILQGAPGVGKTFVAKRLARALIGSTDPQRVEMIQFHQSYSYEDFIQGFRPTPKGHFDLKYGIFYQFCRRAQRDESAKKPYVFIIDEINRGNLSKIFGELMMLIEPDKRGKEHAIPLAYCQDADEKFHIPENLHLIGTMNTADRSLAMVDYALRRRFRFIMLRPEFGSKTFHDFLVEAGAWRELATKIVSRMTSLNEVIAADTKNLGPGYQIGHSYFCPRSGIKPDEDWYRRVVESEIVPLIQEYWFDNEQKVKDQRSALLA
jgi:MoxR-like ATPase